MYTQTGPVSNFSSTNTLQTTFTKNNTIKKDINRVNHPSYYQDPSGVECITVARHRDFNIGNAMKYLWRAGYKTENGITNIDKQIEDLKKAIFYINDEIKMLQDENMR